MKLPVPSSLVGERIDVALAQIMGVSRSQAQQLIKARRVKFYADSDATADGDVTGACHDVNHEVNCDAGHDANQSAAQGAIILSKSTLVASTGFIEVLDAGASALDSLSAVSPSTSSAASSAVSLEAASATSSVTSSTASSASPAALSAGASASSLPAATPITPLPVLPIAYEDEDIIIINKPVGVAAHAARGWHGASVVECLAAQGVAIEPSGEPGRAGIVSRLDVGTSGLMLVCKTAFAYERIREQFSAHTVIKVYHALVQGNLKLEKATIDAPLGRSSVADFRFSVQPDGKPAITHWDVLERFGEATLAQVVLETGRTHQIRAHFAAIGHPLVGDSMYGANPVLAHELQMSRQWLHAVKLAFTHPRTGKRVSVEIGYPEDLRHSLTLLRAKHAAA